MSFRYCPRCCSTAVIEDGYCGHCDQCTLQPTNPEPFETYSEARRKFQEAHTLMMWNPLPRLDLMPPLDALALATELQRLCQKRANEAALAKEENLEGKL